MELGRTIGQNPQLVMTVARNDRELFTAIRRMARTLLNHRTLINMGET